MSCGMVSGVRLGALIMNRRPKRGRGVRSLHEAISMSRLEEDWQSHEKADDHVRTDLYELFVVFTLQSSGVETELGI